MLRNSALLLLAAFAAIANAAEEAATAKATAKATNEVTNATKTELDGEKDVLGMKTTDKNGDATVKTDDSGATT
eukprot:CAMPEP_0168290774 /NCGR_PEP_ID=MMETSP0142_2-20121227/5667_1 /TAXON_ID=44445 /ORGANISM="Pseudo-nitzschia australis, Strain 10249 10 AB" /LENGTH=73 /DNA_ID=CAMNT_0008238017 /DNA_START=1 /DNA_END=218 /DNA_ORIENTATION=+